ncbi:MAG: DUF4406 domain-containing protein [Lachnospirales bacterium]
MDKNIFNAEGYKDVTAYKAIKNVAKADKQSAYLPLVYICSPYRGDVDKNVMKARRYSYFAVTENTIPVTPHLLFPQFMYDDIPSQRQLAMHFNYVLLGKCSQLWVFGDVISEGMEYEINLAKKRFMKIRYFDSSCKEVK